MASEIKLPKSGDGMLLREFRQADGAPLADIEFDHEVKKFLKVPCKEKSVWLENFTAGTLNNNGHSAIEVEEGVLAGCASLTDYQESYYESPTKKEFRVVIARLFWGEKYRLGRKTAEILIRAAFEEIGSAAVIAVVHPNHEKCQDLIKSLGFEYREIKKCDDWQNGHLIYELTRDKYKETWHL